MMNPVDFFKLRTDKIFTYIFLILALLIPGYGYLTLTNLDLLLKLNYLNVIMSSFFYSLPIFICGLFFYIINLATDNNTKNTRVDSPD